MDGVRKKGKKINFQRRNPKLEYKEEVIKKFEWQEIISSKHRFVIQV